MASAGTPPAMPGPTPAPLPQLSQMSPAQLSTWTGPQLADLGLRIVAMPLESLAKLEASQIAALSPMQAAALASRMAAQPPEAMPGDQNIWRAATPTPEARSGTAEPIAGLGAAAAPPPLAPLGGAATPPAVQTPNLQTPARAIEVMPQIAEKTLSAGDMLHQLVQTGTGSAGLDAFLDHHLASEAVGLVAARQVSGKTELASSVQELFAQAVNGPVRMESVVEEHPSATCRAVLSASDRADAARVFEGVILLSLNPAGRIDQLSFIDDHPGGSTISHPAT